MMTVINLITVQSHAIDFGLNCAFETSLDPKCALANFYNVAYISNEV